MSIRMANVLCNAYCRAVVILSLLIYWVISVWGCMHIELGLTPEKLFLPDSPVLKSVSFESNLLLDVFLHRPPNFTDDSETATFYAMVNELEQMPECLGHASTNLWLRSFEDYLILMEV